VDEFINFVEMGDMQYASLAYGDGRPWANRQVGRKANKMTVNYTIIHA